MQASPPGIAADAARHETVSESHIVSPDNLKTGTMLQSKTASTVECEKFTLLRDDRQHTPTPAEVKPSSPTKTSENSGFDYEDDSSNDDSSYFADPIHLPKPKSDKRFAWCGNTAAVNPSPGPLPKSKSRESDASLSLSDDSDADETDHVKEPQLASFPPNHAGFYGINNQFTPTFSPAPSNIKHLAGDARIVQQTNTIQTGAPEFYPQQLTRMHSVSSLVSGSSNNSTASDTSIRDELRDVTVEYSRGRKSEVPSGRLSPVLGEHPPSRNQSLQFASPSTVNPGPSPPQLLQSGGIQAGSYLHPQPHAMTPQYIQAWNQFTNGAPTSVPNLPTTFATTATRGFSSSGLQSNGNMNVNPNTVDEMKASTPKDDTRSTQRSEGSLRSTSHHSTVIMLGQQYSGFADDEQTHQNGKGFKIYWQRWVMLFYMSLLNLLSDWTCYSVAPIALLTEEAFGHINAEQLVTIFLIANAVASACEPMILARLGLRRTVLFGALLLMIGNITKSGGMPPIIQANLKKGSGEWRVYLGFFIVGLSQPLYQCTPALLSASWFPEAERTLATGVALNSNQLGIGFAFIFGTLLVADSNDIPSYFSLLSVISTLAFLGTLIQFSDAPPTPPSETAKVVRGTLEVNLPNVSSFFESVRNIGQTNPDRSNTDHPIKIPSPFLDQRVGLAPAPANGDTESLRKTDRKHRQTEDSLHNATEVPGSSSQGSKARRRLRKSKTTESRPLQYGNVGYSQSGGQLSTSSSSKKAKKRSKVYPSPSPALSGAVDPSSLLNEEGEGNVDEPATVENISQMHLPEVGNPSLLFSPDLYSLSDGNSGHQQMQQLPFNPYQYYNTYAYTNWHPNFNQYAYYYQQQAYQHGFQIPLPPVADQFYQYYSYQHAIPPPPHMRGYEAPETLLPPSGLDEGVEPVLTITPHHLDINIRDDQVILSLKACMARPGFVHSLVSFTVSGIVINTLSTFMDYLVRLNGAGREYTGIVGGSFQFVIMISSLIVGQWCDKTRAYYSITIGMLVLGAFGLAECGVSLDADRGNELRWALVVVAALVGPLQPVSTELGVDVVYPLSENTVLVIQQLFSNLLSAAFIPCFKAMRDIGRGTLADGVTPKPQYTFSFYLLIVLHAVCTVFFATFNGRYLRYEHEQDRIAEEERKKAQRATRAFQPLGKNHEDRSEHTPLLSSV